jgi:prevent-host-death family protein
MGFGIEGEQMVSATELSRSFGRYLDVAEARDVVILKHNRPVAVLMDFERYEQLRKQNEELLELMEHMAIYRLVREREGSAEEELVLKTLAAKYGL